MPNWKRTLPVFAAGMIAAGLLSQAVNHPASAQQGSANSGHAADKTVSYSLGWDLGSEATRNMASDGVTFDRAAMIAGFSDAIGGADSKISDRARQIALIEFNDEIFAARIAHQLATDPVYRAFAEENRKAGEAFKKKFEKLEGAQKTPAGGVFKIERQGTGASPKPGDVVVLNYTIALLNGEEVARAKGETIDSALMLPGAQRMLPTMKVGEKRIILLAPSGAAGLAGRGMGIGPNETVLAEVELVGIVGSGNE